MIMDDLEFLKNDTKKAEYLQDILINHATGGSANDLEYKNLRKFFLDSLEYENLLPDFVRTKRDLSQFWSFIKNKFGTYAERRGFIWEEFSKLLNFLEKRNKNSISESLSNKQLSNLDANTIHNEIQKGLKRIKTDPEGAITLARTILESTCKFIATQKEITYTDKDDLSIIYKNIAKELNLSPDQHNEDIFKQILGGCSGIVSGLGALRNRFGDAHGKGVVKIKPMPRHAELAVNLAGTMAVFLIETHESQNINF